MTTRRGLAAEAGFKTQSIIAKERGFHRLGRLARERFEKSYNGAVGLAFLRCLQEQAGQVGNNDTVAHNSVLRAAILHWASNKAGVQHLQNTSVDAFAATNELVSPTMANGIGKLAGQLRHADNPKQLARTLTTTFLSCAHTEEERKAIGAIQKSIRKSSKQVFDFFNNGDFDFTVDAMRDSFKDLKRQYEARKSPEFQYKNIRLIQNLATLVMVTFLSSLVEPSSHKDRGVEHVPQHSGSGLSTTGHELVMSPSVTGMNESSVTAIPQLDSTQTVTNPEVLPPIPQLDRRNVPITQIAFERFDPANLIFRLEENAGFETVIPVGGEIKFGLVEPVGLDLKSALVGAELFAQVAEGAQATITPHALDQQGLPTVTLGTFLFTYDESIQTHLLANLTLLPYSLSRFNPSAWKTPPESYTVKNIGGTPMRVRMTYSCDRGDVQSIPVHEVVLGDTTLEELPYMGVAGLVFGGFEGPWGALDSFPLDASLLMAHTNVTAYAGFTGTISRQGTTAFDLLPNLVGKCDVALTPLEQCVDASLDKLWEKGKDRLTILVAAHGVMGLVTDPGQTLPDGTPARFPDLRIKVANNALVDFRPTLEAIAKWLRKTPLPVGFSLDLNFATCNAQSVELSVRETIGTVSGVSVSSNFLTDPRGTGSFSSDYYHIPGDPSSHEGLLPDFSPFEPSETPATPAFQLGSDAPKSTLGASFPTQNFIDNNGFSPHLRLSQSDVTITNDTGLIRQMSVAAVVRGQVVDMYHFVMPPQSSGLLKVNPETTAVNVGVTAVLGDGVTWATVVEPTRVEFPPEPSTRALDVSVVYPCQSEPEHGLLKPDCRNEGAVSNRGTTAVIVRPSLQSNAAIPLEGGGQVLVPIDGRMHVYDQAGRLVEVVKPSAFREMVEPDPNANILKPHVIHPGASFIGKLDAIVDRDFYSVNHHGANDELRIENTTSQPLRVRAITIGADGSPNILQDVAVDAGKAYLHIGSGKVYYEISSGGGKYGDGKYTVSRPNGQGSMEYTTLLPCVATN